MAERIVAVFDSEAEADRAQRTLESRIPASLIRRYRPGEAGAPTLKDSPTTGTTGTYAPTGTGMTDTSTTGGSGGGFWAWLMGEEGTTSDHRQAYGSEYETHRAEYDEHIGAGRAILVIEATDQQQAADVMRLLENYPAEQVELQPSSGLGADRRTSTTAPLTGVGTAGIEPVDERAETHTSRLSETDRLAATTETGTAREAEQVIPLSEEQLEVGKRAVVGTTRIRRYVVETPVERQINLRDERATIERRAATGTTAGPDAFEERTVEVRESHEEPVVSKTAQVREEVVVNREGTEHTETVRDKVRREEVDIDKSDRTDTTRDAGTTRPVRE